MFFAGLQDLSYAVSEKLISICSSVIPDGFSHIHSCILDFKVLRDTELVQQVKFTIPYRTSRQ
jgi:hypothetical protein